MLRLFVLGEVPGTDIYLSFGQVMLLLGAFYATLIGIHELHHLRPVAPTPEDIAL